MMMMIMLMMIMLMIIIILVADAVVVILRIIVVTVIVVIIIIVGVVIVVDVVVVVVVVIIIIVIVIIIVIIWKCDKMFNFLDDQRFALVYNRKLDFWQSPQREHQQITFVFPCLLPCFMNPISLMTVIMTDSKVKGGGGVPGSGAVAGPSDRFCLTFVLWLLTKFPLLLNKVLVFVVECKAHMSERIQRS